MKLYNKIGSKERFVEMFQKINKLQLNEVATNVVQTGTQLIEKAFAELSNKEANVSQTNTQTAGDDNFVEIVTNDKEGNTITFTFKVSSNEADQDGVFDVGNAKLSGFKIQSELLNVDMPENMQAVQEFNQNHSGEIMDVISQYANFETNTSSVEDEVYEEAIKLIDKVPYNKPTDTMQTSKAYGDQKPTNPNVRVQSNELSKYLEEMQDFTDDDYTQDSPEEDPLALPPEYGIGDLPQNTDDDGSIGVDPYTQTNIDDEPLPQVSPQKAAIITQAYDALVNAGNPSPTIEQVQAYLNPSQSSVNKTRTIPKGAEAFYEGESMVNTSNVDKRNYITQADDILTKRLGAQKLNMPKQEYALMVKDLATKIYHIGIRGMNEEQEKNNYPDPIGKKFKPKNQMPKKKRKPQSSVKLSEDNGNQVQGGKADEKDPIDFNPQQIMIGMGIEMEHTDDPKIALEIAMDHLMEIPDYYTRLNKMEKEASVEEPVDEIKTGEHDEELTDELLGFKPHNVGEDYDYAAAERDYEDREDMRNHPEDYEGDTQHPLSDVLDSDGTEEDLSKQNVGEKGINMSEIQDREEMEYPGEIGDRYEDAENNNYTVKDKGVGDGEVTLQGHEGEQEITTQDLQYLKKLGESRERIELAKNVMRKKVITEGMSKKEAALILVNHYIK